MVTINRVWWEHLAPKAMRNRVREIESVLGKWCRTEYGAHWLSVAQHPEGIMRAKPGQFIPIAHMVALGDQPFFVGPQFKVREGHRTVGTPVKFTSGESLNESELVLRPTIRVEIVRDPALLAAAFESAVAMRAGQKVDFRGHNPNVQEPSVILSIPAHYLLVPTTWPKRGFVLYQHIFGDGSNYPDDGWFYVGVTTRSWQARWTEHRHASLAGSPLLFHRKMRDEQASGRLTYVHHKVMGITDDLETLYNSEESLVAGHWDDARRLNMIPGGKAGIKYMREHGMFDARVAPMPDERERILEKWMREHPRAGLPAPWVSEKWKDDAWAIAQICGREGRLSIDQVRAIRLLSKQHSVAEIAERIGARNVAQVQRVIEGKTYSRVPAAGETWEP